MLKGKENLSELNISGIQARKTVRLTEAPQ